MTDKELQRLKIVRLKRFWMFRILRREDFWINLWKVGFWRRLERRKGESIGRN